MYSMCLLPMDVLPSQVLGEFYGIIKSYNPEKGSTGPAHVLALYGKSSSSFQQLTTPSARCTYSQLGTSHLLDP